LKNRRFITTHFIYQRIKKYANHRRIALCYWLRDRLPFLIEKIDLRRALLYGEAGHDAGRWAELTGNMQRASLLISESPHVKLLEQYREMSDTLFLYKIFEETAYFKNAMECVQITRNYFGQSNTEGIMAQADYVNHAADFDVESDDFSGPGKLPSRDWMLTLVKNQWSGDGVP